MTTNEERPIHEHSQPPEFMFIRASLLNIDPKYQREFNPHHAKSIAKNFDWDTCGQIDVNERQDGSLWVFDGQHRLRAAQMVFGEDVAVPCLVYRFRPMEWEASQFDQRQKLRRATSPLESFTAGLVYGNETALKIVSIAEAHGFKVGGTHGNGSNIRCVGTLQRINKLYADGMLNRVLGVYVSAWKHEQPVIGTVLDAIASCITSANDPAFDKRLVTALENVSVAEIERQTKERAAKYGGRPGVWMRFVVRDIYNKQWPRRKLVLSQEGV